MSPRPFSDARPVALVCFALLCACGGKLSADRDPPSPLPPASAAIDPHPRHRGAACAFDWQCASRRCSADTTVGGCGVCLDARRLGERCDGPLQGCTATARCERGVCKSIKQIAGERCQLGPLREDIGDCDADLYCDASSLASTSDSGTCKARIEVDGRCRPETGQLSSCVQDAVCDAASGRCVIPPVDSCALRSCPQGYRCDRTRTCRPATLQKDARCGIVDGELLDDDCAAGMVCADSRCVPLPAVGDICISEACAARLFCSEQTTDSSGVVPRRCELLRRQGEPCSTDFTFHKDCDPALECRNRKCAVACG